MVWRERPNIVPAVLHVAFYLILSTTVPPSRDFAMHFVDEEMGSKRLNIG